MQNGITTLKIVFGFVSFINYSYHPIQKLSVSKYVCSSFLHNVSSNWQNLDVYQLTNEWIVALSYEKELPTPGLYEWIWYIHYDNQKKLGSECCTLSIYFCSVLQKARQAEQKWSQWLLVRSGQRALGSTMIEMIPCHCGTGCKYIFMFVSVIEFCTINGHIN